MPSNSKKPKLPKQKCCISTSRCKRCPIRMLQEGTLPDGFAVKKRKLVRIEAPVLIVATKSNSTKSKRSKKRKDRKGKRERVRPLAA